MSDYSESENESDVESVDDVVIPSKITKKKVTLAEPSAKIKTLANAADDDEDEEDDDDDDDDDEEAGTKSFVDDADDDAEDLDSDADADPDADEDADNEDILEKKSGIPKEAAPSKIGAPSRFSDALFGDSDFDTDGEGDDAHGAEGDDYLQKFDEKTRENIIADYYPELVQQNYDEIAVLATVVRDEDGAVCDPLHTTIPFITKYEKTRIIGERARQINAGAKPFVEVPDDLIDGYLIALREYEQKKIPFIIKRPLPNGGIEYWRVEDLELI